jgi:hypothetical protein
MDFYEYDRYIVNAKSGDKPWLLFFMYTPYSGNAQKFDNYTMHLETLICFTRHFDINIGILDYRIHEEIFEAYNYKLGYFDRSIPYYMIAHEGKMHQLEHNPGILSWKLEVNQRP